MIKQAISQHQIRRKYAAKKLREVLYVTDSLYGKSENIKIPNKSIDSIIFSSLFQTLKYESIGNKDKIEQVVETILYGRELEDFKKFDYTTRKELLDSYQLTGIKSISKREEIFNSLEEEEKISKITSRNRIKNLEEKLEKTNKIRRLIPEVEMNQNSFEYLNSFIDLYQALKGENGIEKYEIEDIKYQSQLLALIKNKPEVTAIETQDILLNLYDEKFKGIKKNNFFQKLREIYLLKTNGAASQIKKLIPHQSYTPKIKNTQQTKKPEKTIQIEEKLEITPEDEFNLKLAEYNINKAEIIQTNIQEKFDEELKTIKPITQADKLKELVQQQEKKLKIQAEYCPTRKHHIGYEMIE